MGTLSNTNEVTMTVPSGANDETPTHFSVWNHATNEAATNFMFEGDLVDDDTDATPVFDVATGGSLVFAAGKIQVTTSLGTTFGERFYQVFLDTSGTGHVQLHTGDPGNARTSNKMTDVDRFEVDAWTYAT